LTIELRVETVPRIERIMGRANEQVNGGMRSCALLVALLVALFGVTGCSDESAAQRAYERAQRHIESDEIDEAVQVLESIVETYPETEIARTAREDLTLYRGLSVAVDA